MCKCSLFHSMFSVSSNGLEPLRSTGVLCLRALCIFCMSELCLVMGWPERNSSGAKYESIIDTNFSNQNLHVFYLHVYLHANDSRVSLLPHCCNFRTFSLYYGPWFRPDASWTFVVGFS